MKLKQIHVPATGLAVLLAGAVIGAGVGFTAEERPLPGQSLRSGTNSFPDLNEVLQGRTFESAFQRDVFFLQTIQSNYPAHWAPLLQVNISAGEYVQSPEKLLRFVDELGTAVAGTDDVFAISNLAAIVSDPVYCANTNAYRPGISQAAAWALIKIGPKGRQTLANSFTESRYRADPVSLEVLADAIGRSGVGDEHLAAALSATVFCFTTTKGGHYPRCTEQATRALLRLPGGTSAVVKHLNGKEVLNDPGRFQAVIDGIAAARALALSTNLRELATQAAAKLSAIPAGPSAYREDLCELQARLKKTMDQFAARATSNN